MTGPHRRFKNLRARLKAKALQSPPHRPHDHRGGEMRVRRRAARRLVFLVRQESTDLNANVAPFGRRIRVENIRQGSPSGIPDEEGFLGFRRFTLTGFNALESADRSDVVAGLFL
jgi:hypothetical protein